MTSRSRAARVPCGAAAGGGSAVECSDSISVLLVTTGAAPLALGRTAVAELPAMQARGSTVAVAHESGASVDRVVRSITVALLGTGLRDTPLP